MTPVRLGGVGYLNARPLVFGLDGSPRFALRYDLPSECARLLGSGDIDLGLIPSIEYLRGDAYRIVPDVAVASRGPVASVAIFTTRPMADVRSIVMDTSSRTSVALVHVLCARLFGIQPAIESHRPDLPAMLARGDAALIIGDNALLLRDRETLPSPPGASARTVEKIDLGDAWTSMTGLPFVWALWAGRAAALADGDVEALQAARDGGVCHAESIGRAHFGDASEHGALAARYLRDNIKYHLGAEERAGLELFYRYAAEAGAAPPPAGLRFFGRD